MIELIECITLNMCEGIKNFIEIETSSKNTSDENTNNN